MPKQLSVSKRALEEKHDRIARCRWRSQRRLKVHLSADARHEDLLVRAVDGGGRLDAPRCGDRAGDQRKENQHLSSLTKKGKKKKRVKTPA